MNVQHTSPVLKAHQQSTTEQREPDALLVYRLRGLRRSPQKITEAHRLVDCQALVQQVVLHDVADLPLGALVERLPVVQHLARHLHAPARREIGRDVLSRFHGRMEVTLCTP